MEIIEIDKKKSFKIMLNSRNTASRSGASTTTLSYTVDFRSVIRSDIDYSKQYKVYCSFISNINTTAITGIDALTNNYGLYIDMGKGQNIYQFNNTRAPSFILPVVSMSATQYGFLLNEYNQLPIIVNNIRDITTITLSVIASSTGIALVAGTNFGYMCCLTFEEC
jgi:hypothetical protein